MILFVDTSVWSLAWRRDNKATTAEVSRLRAALEGGESLVTTGLVLQELLQGFAGPKAHEQITQRLAALPFVFPDRQDHVDAAKLRNQCRRSGIQVGTVDAVIAQLCVRHRLALLTADLDFARIAKHCELRVWKTGEH